tara:strand:+ start:358 stop:741 length:384 start_codon:yes stop_codon:yes gene_type:complete
MRGNAIDKTIEMNYDFLMNSLDFLFKNLDQIIMMTIIIFLVMAWTWAFEWKMPKKKDIILQKNIGIEVTEWTGKEKNGYMVDSYGRRLDNLGNVVGTNYLGLNNLKTKEGMLNATQQRDVQGFENLR